MTVNGTQLEARYRQALLDKPEVSKVTLADSRQVEVKDIYVHRTLLHEVVKKEPEREITVKLPVELWPKLRDERVVLVEGSAGMGKSTLTKQLVRESETYHLIPIWIPFRQFVSSGLSILEYLEQHYIPWLGLSDLRVPDRADEMGRTRSLGQWCYDQWQSSLGVLILDGLDEVFRHEERVAVLKALPITGTGRTRPATILTSRPLSQSIPLQMVKVEVQGLTPSDQIKLIDQYRATLQLTDEQIGRFTRATTEREHSRFRELLTRPGHLIQILTTYATTNTLVETETAVLNSLLESRLSITDRSEPPIEGGDAKKKWQVLASLALHLLACRQGQRHTRAQLLTLIHQILREHRQAGTPLFLLSQGTALLHDLVRNSGLLTEAEPEVYEFETVIWLQHLTGLALAYEPMCTALQLSKSHVLDFLDKKAWDPEWEPVLKSWVGNTEHPFQFFTNLMDKQQDDLARHRLGVAGRCLSEVRLERKQQSQYQRLVTRVPREAFVVWKGKVKRNSENFVTTSLERAWVETQVGQTKLLALLQSSHPMRVAAVEILAKLGAAMPVAVQEALVAQLSDPDRAVRRVVVQALGELGEAMPVPVQQALVARLTGQEFEVRLVAARALGKLGAVIAVSVQEALLARLADPDREVRLDAIRAFKEMGGAMPVPVQQALVAQIAGPDEFVRWAAARALGELGPAMAVPVEQALVARLVDSNQGVCWAADEALKGRGAIMPVPMQQALVARLTDLDRAVRRAAVMSLKRLGAAMPVPVQEALVARLTDLDGAVRWSTVRALGSLGAAMPVPVQEALVARLMDLDSGVRQEAANALGKLGTAMPVPVQEALVALMMDPDKSVRQEAAKALGELGTTMPVSVQEALVAGLTRLDRDVRWAAVGALKRSGASMAVPVQQALVARLANPTRYVRVAAALAFEELGTAMPVPVQQALVAQLAAPDLDMCNVVGAVLEKLGVVMAVPVQQALVAGLADSNKAVRRLAAGALSFAQRQGVRFFLQGAGVGEGRLVSELSATVPFPDSCHKGFMYTPTALGISFPSRLPLTVI